MTVGFLGLGRMGEPMATRLAAGGVPLTVWSRRQEPVQRLTGAGATAAMSAGSVFSASEVVLLMLANPAAIDAVLERDPRGFGVPVTGRLVVNLGTVAPEYSCALKDQLRRRGARFVEAPVSGSRVPAQEGTLVAMLAGDPPAVKQVRPLIGRLAAAVFACGPVPRALETKLAVNVFLLSLVAGLAESTAFAEARGVDLEVFRAVLDAGPMASAVSSLKLAKLLGHDLEAQASVSDVLYNNRLILEAASDPQQLQLMRTTERLFARAESLGHGADDMVAVIEAMRRGRD